MKTLGKIACALAFHRWGEWRQFPGSGYKERRTCKRSDCTVTQTRFV